MPETTILISIEGNIGSGKSTVLKMLKEKYPEWIFVDEPVDDWLALKNQQGESLLEVFYKDKKRWSYTFQNAAVLYRYKKLRAALELVQPGSPNIIVMERCLESDRQLFCRMLRKDGFIDDLEKTLYEDWFAHLNEMLPPVDAHIYINTAPEVAFERVAKRARQGESIIPLDYLKELDTYHRFWLIGNKHGKPVLDYDNHSSSVDVKPIGDYVYSLLEGKNNSL